MGVNQMSACNADLQCLHCGVELSEATIAAGWCEDCGKRVPPSMQYARKKQTPAFVPGADATPASQGGSWRKLVVGGAIFVGIAVVAVLAVFNLS
jgi:hypothetical protein